MRLLIALGMTLLLLGCKIEDSAVMLACLNQPALQAEFRAVVQHPTRQERQIFNAANVTIRKACETPNDPNWAAVVRTAVAKITKIIFDHKGKK